MQRQAVWTSDRLRRAVVQAKLASYTPHTLGVRVGSKTEPTSKLFENHVFSREVELDISGESMTNSPNGS